MKTKTLKKGLQRGLNRKRLTDISPIGSDIRNDITIDLEGGWSIESDFDKLSLDGVDGFLFLHVGAFEKGWE